MTVSVLVSVFIAVLRPVFRGREIEEFHSPCPWLSLFWNHAKALFLHRNNGLVWLLVTQIGALISNSAHFDNSKLQFRPELTSQWLANSESVSTPHFWFPIVLLSSQNTTTMNAMSGNRLLVVHSSFEHLLIKIWPKLVGQRSSSTWRKTKLSTWKSVVSRKLSRSTRNSLAIRLIS